MNKQKLLFLLVIIHLCLFGLFFIIQFSNQPRSYDKSQRYFFQQKQLNTTKINAQTESIKPRVILIVLDAADFALNQKFQIIQKLIKNKEKNSLFFKAIVNWPTLTNAKLEAMMTGTEVFSPTSVFRSFYSQYTPFDNIISSLQNRGEGVVALGVNHWSELFKLVSYQCKANFNIWSFEGCDNFIYQNFDTVIQNSSYSLVLPQFTAFDHLGHSSLSSQGIQFDREAKKINDFIEQKLPKLNKNDYVLIIGDHGLTKKGNHGGWSKKQTTVFFFAHSVGDAIRSVFTRKTPISLPDITATIALLLNVPIPKNSIGIPIFIPQYLTKQLNKSYEELQQDILETTLEQFSEITDFSKIECPEIQALKKNQTNLDPQHMKQIQTKCFEQLLLPKPNFTFLRVIVVGMGILCILATVFLEIKVVYWLLLICVGVPFAFKWICVTHLSSYYLISLLMFVFVTNKSKPFNRLIVLAQLVLVSQFEEVLTYRYVVNFFYIPFLGDILKSNSFQYFVAIVVFCVIFLIPHTKFKDDEIKQKAVSSKIKYILLPTILISQIAKIYTQSRTQGNNIDSNLNERNMIMGCNYFISLVLLLLLAIRIHIKIKPSSVWKKSSDGYYDTTIQMMSFLSIFNNHYYWVVATMFVLISKRCLNFEGTIKPIVTYLLSQSMWCIMGFKYDFAFIDIQHSYAYSTQFHPMINPICLFFNIANPFLLFGFLQFPNYVKETQKQYKTVQQQQQIEGQNREQQSQTSKKLLQQFNFSFGFIVIPMISLTADCLRLIQQKIRFGGLTVFIPLVLIQGIKIVALLSVAMSVILIRRIIRSKLG